MLGFAMVVLLMPFGKFDNSFVKVKLYTSDTQVLLKAEQGQLTLPRPSLDAPYLNLIESSNIQRLELVPYGGSIECNVMDSSGKRYSSSQELCIALALKFDKNLYVYPELLQSSNNLKEESKLGL